MNIIFISAEVAPFSKAGGLADVSGALPQQLSSTGHNISVVSPLYSKINREMDSIRTTGIGALIQMGNEDVPFELYNFDHNQSDGPHQYFIHNDDLFGREGIYTLPNGEGFADNNFRYFFFQKAIIKLIEIEFFKPDLVHCNDHHTAMLPFFIINRKMEIATILTVHNFQYQGYFSQDEGKYLDELDAQRLVDIPSENRSSMYLGCTHAHQVNTVSPTYAVELLNIKELSYELHSTLNNISHKFSGILNGADYSYWSPENDTFIKHQYIASNLFGKSKNKVDLQIYCGFKNYSDKPLIGSISRLVENKGFYLILDIIPDLVEMGVQCVFLGSGMDDISQSLKDFANQYPDNIFYEGRFNEELAHNIEAGADMFLMPSRFEPCGLNQIYSLKYGTIPLVYKTGGLADTVQQWDGKNGNGFLFDQYTSSELLNMIQQAVKIWDDKKQWSSIISNAMEADFSWNQSAKQYIGLYETALEN
jgi:starch synthase